MFQETYLLGWLQGGASIIYKSSPEKEGMWCCVDGLVFKLLHIQVCHNGTYRGSHGSAFLLFIKPVLENEICNCKAVLQQSGDVLLPSSWSSSSIFLMVLMASLRGTEVNNALTSKETTHWSCCSLMSFICWMKSCVSWTWYMDLSTRCFRILASYLAVS